MKYSYGDKVKILIGFFRGRTGKILDVKETNKGKETMVSYEVEFIREKGEKPVKEWFDEFQIKKETFLEKDWF